MLTSLLFLLGLVASVARAEPPPSSAVGGLQVSGASGTLTPQLAAQGQVDAAIPGSASLRFRRSRFSLKGTTSDNRFQGRTQLNLQPGNAELLDLWLGVRVRPKGRLVLRAGQLKVPFTRYRAQSYQRLVIVDWEAATKAFGAERQMGIEATTGLPPSGGLNAAFGVFGGANRRTSFETLVPDSLGLDPANPSGIAGGSSTVALEPEVVGRITWSSAGLDARTGFDHEGGPLRVLVGLSGAWDSAPDPRADLATRGAVETMVQAGGWTVTGVGYLGSYEAPSGETGSAGWGALGELTWVPAPTWGLSVSSSFLGLGEALEAEAERVGADATTRKTDLGGGVSYFARGTGLLLRADAAWCDTATRLDPDRSQGWRVRGLAQVVF